MRILQVHNTYREPGGEDTVVEAEKQLLEDAGHQVSQHKAENPHSTLEAALTLARAPWNPNTARQVRQVARLHQPDLVHIHNTWYALSPSVVRALHSLGLPVVMTLHNYRLVCANSQLFRDGRPCEDCVGTHPWHGVAHRCYRGSAVASLVAAGTIAVNQIAGTWTHHVDRFLVPSPFAASRLVEGGLPASKVSVKPHFVVDPGERSQLPSQSHVVLFVGRISLEKGLEVALEAWRQARTGGLELWVIGEGPDRSNLEADAPPGVRFLGRLASQEVTRLMLEARLLVFPSVWYETQGMVLLEALAAGLPVLASRLGAVPDTLTDLGPSCLVDPGIPESWATAIDGLIDGDRLDYFGTLARASFLRRYSPTVALQTLEDTYRMVMHESI